MITNDSPNYYKEDHLNEANYISTSDSENDLLRKFPDSSSSESEMDTDPDKSATAKRPLSRHINRLIKPLRRSLKNTANAGITVINAADRVRRRFKQNKDDQRVQARQDLKYARRHPDLPKYKDSVTKGQSLLGRGMFPSLLQVTESNGNTVYGNIMEGNLQPPKFQLVTDFINLNFLENIYFIRLKLGDSGEDIRILVAAYPIESIIENGDDTTSFYSFDDFAFFPYELIDSKLATLPTYANKVLDLKSMEGNISIIAEIGEHFPSTTEEDDNGNETTTWSWDQEIANSLARDAILKNLTQIMEEEIKRKLEPGEVVELYKYNLETGTKENLRVLSEQGALHAPNVMQLLSQFTFGPNIRNRNDFMKKIHILHELPLSKGSRADYLTNNIILINKKAKETMPIKAATAVRVRTQKEKDRAEARFNAATLNRGGSLKKTKKKRSKRYRKTKKYRKTNKRRKHRSNKSKNKR